MTSPDRGQATIEFAFAIPIVLMLSLGVVQVAIVARDQLALERAARVAARAAAVAPAPAAAADRAAHAAIALGPLTTHTNVAGDFVTVTVRHTNPTAVPLIGALVPDVPLQATATMHLEPP